MARIIIRASGALLSALGVMCARHSVVAQTPPCPPAQLQRLISPCNDGNGFGRSLSVRDDRMAVGRYDLPGGRISTYVLNPITQQWDFESDLRPHDLRPFDAFGNAVAFHFDSSSNEWLLAGASPYNSLIDDDAGKVYVFRLNSSMQWVQDGEVLPDVSVPFGWFGNELAWATAGGRTFLIVGAPGSDSTGVIGSAYVFERDGLGAWRQQAHLQAPDGSPEDAFGFGLSASESDGSTILTVGASGHLYVGPNTQPGAAYFYRFDSVSNAWMLEAQFEAPDPYEQDLFGQDVSVAPVVDLPGISHRAAVGRTNEGGFGFPAGPGATYLYLRTTEGTWRQEAHLVPPVANPSDMFFGQSVCLESGGTARLLAAAPENRDFGVSSGCVYVFELIGPSGEWSAVQALYGAEQDVLDAFGFTVALGDRRSASLAVIGAHTTQCVGGLQIDAVGAVYSFDLDPGEPGNCPPPVLTLQKVPDCAGGQGGEIEVRWFQATPDRRARIAILFGRRTGNFVIPNGNPCAGTPLGLGALDLQVAFIGSAGDFGAGRLVTTIPRSACGAYLQLVDVSRCKTSNVVRIE